MAGLAGGWHPGVLRVDPLFPRSPLPTPPSSLRDSGMEEAQTLDDLEHLAAFAREVGGGQDRSASGKARECDDGRRV